MLTSFWEKPGSMNLKNIGAFFWDISEGFLGLGAMDWNNMDLCFWDISGGSFIGPKTTQMNDKGTSASRPFEQTTFLATLNSSYVKKSTDMDYCRQQNICAKCTKKYLELLYTTQCHI